MLVCALHHVLTWERQFLFPIPLAVRVLSVPHRRGFDRNVLLEQYMVSPGRVLGRSDLVIVRYVSARMSAG